jgi:hypothetical protein
MGPSRPLPLEETEKGCRDLTELQGTTQTDMTAGGGGRRRRRRRRHAADAAVGGSSALLALATVWVSMNVSSVRAVASKMVGYDMHLHGE